MEPHRLALPVGFQIEHFRIEAVLGKGGFGITYLAVDLKLGKRVALKELLPDTIATRVEGLTVVPHSVGLEENWEWARDRFLEEARTLATFSHPAIVGVHRLIEANGTVYMVMDYVEGESYEARLQRIGTEPDQASLMAVIGPILSGLEEVHAHGLLHRDIKPENILIDKRGQPVLIDFGSARESVGKTMTMTSIVTHGYSPIEQYQTKGRMGPWTDIYAIAAVMCRAITGEKPPVATDRLVADDFVWLSQLNMSEFSLKFRSAIDRGLAIRTEDRPTSLREWHSLLELLESGAPQPNSEQKTSTRKSEPSAHPYGPPPPAWYTGKIEPPKETAARQENEVKTGNKTILVAALAALAVISFVLDALDAKKESSVTRASDAVATDMQESPQPHPLDEASSDNSTTSKELIDISKLFRNSSAVLFPILKHDKETNTQHDINTLRSVQHDLVMARLRLSALASTDSVQALTKQVEEFMELWTELAPPEINWLPSIKQTLSSELITEADVLESHSLRWDAAHVLDKALALDPENGEILYRLGRIQTDSETKAKYYTQATEKGNLDAQVELGRCYMLGHGVDEDTDKAIELWLSAATQGHVMAQSELAFRYANGHNVKKDPAEAAKWGLLAAERGSADANWLVGRLYEMGIGVSETPDLQAAIMWWKKAAQLGSSQAKAKLKRLEN